MGDVLRVNFGAARTLAETRQMLVTMLADSPELSEPAIEELATACMERMKPYHNFPPLTLPGPLPADAVQHVQAVVDYYQAQIPVLFQNQIDLLQDCVRILGRRPGPELR